MHKFITDSLSEAGITTPTEVQSKVIPLLLTKKKDLLAVAQTGTGKTLAFTIPLIQKIEPKDNFLQALVLCPTRELAQQTMTEIRRVLRYQKDIRVEAVVGGEDIEKQIGNLERYTPQILVATPGRLIDLYRIKALDLDDISYVVIDEADEMLKKGFNEDVAYIFSRIGHSVYTWMFCATQDERMQKALEQYLDPKYERVQLNEENLLNPDIEHQYIVCKSDEKRIALRRFLMLHEDKNGIVFCRTKAKSDEVMDDLHAAGFSVAAIHSDLTQKDRDQVMRKFRSGEIKVLVATDIAARGLDIKGLGYVVHYNLPDRREFFNHRCGRTGRAGQKGISMILVFSREVKKIKAIANNLGLYFTKVEYKVENGQVKEQEKEKEKPNKTHEGMVLFYINMGKSDDVNRRNLLEFLSSECDLDPSVFGDMRIERKRSYFYVHHSTIRKLIDGLKGLVVDGKNLVLVREEFDK